MPLPVVGAVITAWASLFFSGCSASSSLRAGLAKDCCNAYPLRLRDARSPHGDEEDKYEACANGVNGGTRDERNGRIGGPGTTETADETEGPCDDGSRASVGGCTAFGTAGCKNRRVRRRPEKAGSLHASVQASGRL